MGHDGSYERGRGEHTAFYILLHVWLTAEQLEEVYELLTGHYVEDDEAMFRFNYSVSFLNW